VLEAWGSAKAQRGAGVRGSTTAKGRRHELDREGARIALGAARDGREFLLGCSPRGIPAMCKVNATSALLLAARAGVQFDSGPTGAAATAQITRTRRPAFLGAAFAGGARTRGS